MWAVGVIMEKDKKRALRRYHNARMLERAKRMVLEWYWEPNPDPKIVQDQARRRRDHMCACSCSGCGNPRNSDWSSRKERLTMPERKAEDSFNDQIADIV